MTQETETTPQGGDADVEPPASLDTLLDDNPASAEPPQAATPETTPEPEAEAETQQAETGDKDDSETAPPADSEHSEDSPPQVPRAALEDERRKRQELERRVADFESQASKPPPQGEAAPQEVPDPFDDPQGYQAHMAQQQQQALYETRADLSREMMKGVHADYEDVEKAFSDFARKQAEAGDPSLAMAVFKAPNPAKFAYEQGKKIKLMAEIGDDPQAFIEAKVKEHLEAQKTAAPATTATTQGTAPPKSLAGTASAPPPKAGETSFEPVPLDQLLKD